MNETRSSFFEILRKTSRSEEEFSKLSLEKQVRVIKVMQKRPSEQFAKILNMMISQDESRKRIIEP